MPPSQAPNLNSCEREPIHIPGSVQPHGALLALDPTTLAVVQASANAVAVLRLEGSPLGRPAAEIVGEDQFRTLTDWAKSAEVALIAQWTVGGADLTAVAHRTDGAILLEFEPAPKSESQTLDALYPRLRSFVEQLQGLNSLDQLCALAARQVRDLTGFDRALIYRFDADWNGTVVGESRNEVLPSYLDLRFPASDIPKQARDLYRMNRLRIIPDAGYVPVPIEPPLDPVAGRPLDLSQSVLRSVSPVHVEYMRNMGTAASMSVSILIDGELWGLVSCHSAAPRLVPLQVRNACDFLGQVLALQIAARLRTEEAARRLELKSIQAELLAHMAREADFTGGLRRNPEAWLRLAGAHGAALVFGDTLFSVGDAPSAATLRSLAEWLQSRGSPAVYATEALSARIGEDPGSGAALRSAELPSGLLAISISQVRASWVMWFRPEVVRTVSWGGDPRKPVEPGTERLHPRRSFEIWKEQERGRSLPWSQAEIDSVRELRDAILEVVLRQAEERAGLTEQLERSNKELEAFSYSISHDLRAPFRHIVGYAELLKDREQTLDGKSRHFLDSIQEAALSAGRLVDDLLSFSHLNRSTLISSGIDMNKLVAEVQRSLEAEVRGREVRWNVGRLPPAHGDPSMLRQVFANLLGNAVKYTRKRSPAEITVSGEDTGDELVYTVADNGEGFDMAYVGKLFGVFQRLHRVEDFEGTGIGLAIARRIVERHGGRIWAHGEPGEGATFRFALPLAKSKDAHG